MKIATNLNGYKEPNKLGIDIFEVWVMPNGIIPHGTNDRSADIPSNCPNSSSSGGGCSSWYLIEDK